MFSSKYSNVLRRGWLMMILLIGSLSAALAQDSAGLRVIGNVTDEKGEPLVAATVYAKNNKSVNAITDLDGNYSIVVPDKWTVLVFDFVGYVTKEETVGERKVINVELVEDIGQLDDAVVVAYGTQKKESVVASITSIEPSALKVSTSRSLTNNLAGNVAGVLAIQRSGEPGYDNSTFWIRGISTFQGVGGDPLVLVDGIERSLDTIDAEEIASFSVLKDAAASAVYGVRGANGVILSSTPSAVRPESRKLQSRPSSPAHSLSSSRHISVRPTICSFLMTSLWTPARSRCTRTRLPRQGLAMTRTSILT